MYNKIYSTSSEPWKRVGAGPSEISFILCFKTFDMNCCLRRKNSHVKFSRILEVSNWMSYILNEDRIIEAKQLTPYFLLGVLPNPDDSKLEAKELGKGWQSGGRETGTAFSDFMKTGRKENEI